MIDKTQLERIAEDVERVYAEILRELLRDLALLRKPVTVVIRTPLIAEGGTVNPCPVLQIDYAEIQRQIEAYQAEGRSVEKIVFFIPNKDDRVFGIPVEYRAWSMQAKGTRI